MGLCLTMESVVERVSVVTQVTDFEIPVCLAQDGKLQDLLELS